MTRPSVIFFGSFQHYSVKVLQALHQAKNVKLLAVVTTPPSPRRSRSQGGPNPVHEYAQSHHLPVFTPEKLNVKSLDTLKSYFLNHKSPENRPDFFIVAGYGKILPRIWLDYPTITPLNLHFSLLPRYRGANPAEWAILMGETQTGVSLTKMTAKLDSGPILRQAKVNITHPTFEGDTFKGGDTRETLYTKLYQLAAKLIVKNLKSYFLNHKSTPVILQSIASPTPYARRLTRADGFISWPTLLKLLQGESLKSSDLPPLLQKIVKYTPMSLCPMPYALCPTLIERATRALYGYPFLWTKVKTMKDKKRMKILSTIYNLRSKKLALTRVHLEGLKPSTFNQIKNQIL